MAEIRPGLLIFGPAAMPWSLPLSRCQQVRQAVLAGDSCRNRLHPFPWPGEQMLFQACPAVQLGAATAGSSGQGATPAISKNRAW